SRRRGRRGLCPHAPPGEERVHGGQHQKGEGRGGDQVPATNQRHRSSPRYCSASDTCSAVIFSSPDRSAMVRATLRTRSWPRAERPRRLTACWRSREASGGTAQNRRSCRPLMRALTRVRPPTKRAHWPSRAASTRARTTADVSPTVPESSAYG